MIARKKFGFDHRTRKYPSLRTCRILDPPMACHLRPLAALAVLVSSGVAAAQLVPPPNDDCPNAIVIGDGTTAGSSTGATISTHGCGLSGLTPDVWYSYTAQHTGLLALTTCGSSFDTTVALYASCALLTQELACNDDAPPGAPCGYQTHDAYLTWPVSAGETVKIRISGFIGSTGPFVLATSNDTGQPFCLGDATSATVCPCANSVPATHLSGCRNSSGVGAHLEALGSSEVGADDVQLVVSGLPGATTVQFFQGTLEQANGYGHFFGDGIRCVTGTVRRLPPVTSVSGVASYPLVGQPRISQIGAIPPQGGIRYYQAWYRNAAAFCTSSTFNLSNGLEIAWKP
jgi:hypothetical protein